MRKIIIILLILLFILPACSTKTNNNDAIFEEDVPWDLRPMIKYDDEIYYYVKDKSEVLSDEIIFDGYIESEIESSEIPVKNNQSNFGKDYKYIINSDEDTIEVYIDDGEWMVFSKESSAPTTTDVINSTAPVPTPAWDTDTLYWSYLNVDGVVYTMATHSGFGNDHLNLENKIVPEANGEPTVEKFIAEEQLEKFASVEKVKNDFIPEEPLAAANLEPNASIYKVPGNDEALYVSFYPPGENMPMQLRLFLPMDFDPKTTDMYFMHKSQPTD
ncbi:MAG: hypothetical protein PHR78_01370 [Eubacteriales bacterium]|nr:hypothetical protein [Eubacteriales bacterium]